MIQHTRVRTTDDIDALLVTTQVSLPGLVETLRPQDEADIQDILPAYGTALDLDFTRGEMESLTESGDVRRTKFEEWVREVLGGNQ